MSRWDCRFAIAAEYTGERGAQSRAFEDERRGDEEYEVSARGLVGEGRLQGIGGLPLALFAFVERVGEADEAVGHAFVARAGDADAGSDEALGETLAFVAQWIVAGSQDERGRQTA